jgi:hypothetical protein
LPTAEPGKRPKKHLEFPVVVSAIRRIVDSGDRLYKRFIGILPPGVFPVLLEYVVLGVKVRPWHGDALIRSTL